MSGGGFVSKACYFRIRCQSCFVLKCRFFTNNGRDTTSAMSHVFLRADVQQTQSAALNHLKCRVKTKSGGYSSCASSFCTANSEEKYKMSEESAALIVEHKLMKKLKKGLKDGVYILYPDIAGDKTDNKHLIGSDKSNSDEMKDTMFIEVNPGLGIVTKGLLRNGVRKLKLLESNKEFVPGLERLRDESLIETMEVIEKDFFKLPKLSYIDKVTFSDNLDRLFDGVRKKLWIESPPLVVFATVPQKYEIKFMRYLLISLAKLNGLFSYGRVQLVLFVSGKEYEYMVFEPQKKTVQYRTASVLYNVFFDVDLLEKEEMRYFYPKPTIRTKRTTLKYDTDHMFLVRLTPKSDLLSRFASPEQLLEFYYFVKQHMIRRKGFVIYSLEKWIPNCGPRLIKEGFTIFTRFGDLSPQQILHLFIQFSSWPEYADSQFRSMLLKSDSLEDHVDDEEERDVEI